MLKPTSFLLAVQLLLGACAGDPHSASTGVGATATGALTVSATPIQTIAPTDSDGVPVFGNIADATRLSSGVIAVVDRGAEAVILVNASGGLAGRSGRRGDGPGEFRSIDGIDQCAPDTLFVWDRSNGRMNVLGPAGEFVSSYRLLGDPVDRYCARSSQFVVWVRFDGLGAPSADAPPITGVAVLLSAAGDSVGALGTLQAGQNRPLGVVTQFAVTDAGVYVGTADSAIVSLYGRTGHRLRTIEAGNARRMTTATEYDAAITRLTNTLPGTAEQVASVRDFMHQRFAMPEYLPAYRAIFTNGNGALFVVTSPLGDGVTELHVFGQAGATRGAVRIPGDLEVFEIGADYLLGMSEDAEGEQRLVVYALATPGL